jgi:hypothetical protein
MIRVFLNFLLFLAPVIIYWLIAMRSDKPLHWRDAPLVWLTLIGFGLFMTGLFVAVFVTQGT